MSRFGENNGKGIKPMVRTIRIPAFDNSDLIRRLKRTTLIGRIMNPDVQSVGSVVLMMPRVWKLEGRVVGKDLGLVTFRFDFEREEDILEDFRRIGNELGTVQSFLVTVLLVLVFAMMKNLAHKATCTIMFRHRKSDASQ
ncbi:uncharacterized protein LOC110226953 isoform X2 [Arabidopsis lyrata subsp. lyrata]|uniref:uncharacterized protein LOC110226953 isoform X2 n=1 Tax=Arabidopsis lyrata subsp. lyrata TaxID=81972 RepID=UPI000A29BCAA|nr:uncharacterized protein LOC110226953 isoform X2 [Arabidopsis lyrata subsp. lyrata]|eukprot:XP_020875631.1 uncharacterized protein LOC110226953 isoform X2 [Arabidopsis lyrata subsp. lyrata]